MRTNFKRALFTKNLIVSLQCILLLIVILGRLSYLSLPCPLPPDSPLGLPFTCHTDSPQGLPIPYPSDFCMGLPIPATLTPPGLTYWLLTKPLLLHCSTKFRLRAIFDIQKLFQFLKGCWWEPKLCAVVFKQCFL